MTPISRPVQVVGAERAHTKFASDARELIEAERYLNSYLICPSEIGEVDVTSHCDWA
jgi:hypothetical protein